MALIGTSAPGGGRADVKVDGKVTRIDTRGTRTNRVVLFQASYAGAGNHTITVTTVGAQPLVVDALAVSNP